jgi:hypothetical protein
MLPPFVDDVIVGYEGAVVKAHHLVLLVDV